MESLSEIACDAADIGAFAAGYAEVDLWQSFGDCTLRVAVEMRGRGVGRRERVGRSEGLATGVRERQLGRAEGCDVETVDGHMFRRNVGLHALAGRDVSPLAVDFHGGEDGRNLLYVAEERLSRGIDAVGVDRVDRIVGVDGLFEVEAWCCGTENHGAAIILDAGLQLVDALGGAADAYQQQAAGQRVECAGVSYLEFFQSEGVLDMPFQLVDDLERGPADRFVDGDNEPWLRRHRAV